MSPRRARPRRAGSVARLRFAIGACAAALAAPVLGALPPAELRAQAVALEHGEGVSKDPLQAALLYCEAAIAGDVESIYALGWMYANGRGVVRDDARAGALFALAAERGHAYAQRMLAQTGTGGAPLPDCLRPPEVPPPPPVEPAPEADPDPDPFVDLPDRQQRIVELVNEVAPRFGIAPRLALAVIAAESNFDPLARSVKDAQGLMQLIPETAARFNVKNPFDARDNVRGGLTYLRWLLAYYQGQVPLAAAAYNAGEKTVDRYGGVPPYPETRDYVKKVLRLFRNEQHPYDAKVVAPSPLFARAGVRRM